MKVIFLLSCTYFFTVVQAQNVGIGTTNPQQMLHVETGGTNKTLLVSGTFNQALALPQFADGSILAFYPSRSALRAGRVYDVEWTNANIGAYSAAIGERVIASGLGSVAMGSFNEATGSYASAFGNFSISRGFSSFVVGVYNDPLIGVQTSISQSTPLFIVGNGANTGRKNALVVLKNGRVFIDASGQNAGNVVDHSLVFGAPGSGEGMASNRLVGGNVFGLDLYTNYTSRLSVTNAGNVGIATSDPKTKLHLSDAAPQSQSLNSFLLIENTGFPGNGARIGFKSSTQSLTDIWTIGGFNDFIAPIGGTQVPATFDISKNSVRLFQVFGTGNATLSGTLTQNSDIRLKTNIRPIEGAMENLQKLNGYHYQWKESFRDGGIQTGLLAQEVANVFPELVKQDAAGTFSVNYSGLIPYLIESSKEQQHVLKILQEENLQLKKRLEILENKMANK